ncbi:MAG: hypothetical protein IPM24_16435 [Bryobacterales bacterium]|nr:hypothetical protein [Bryobacterales bacterium]
MELASSGPNMLGDLEASQGRFDAAAGAYSEALRRTGSRESIRRLREKRRRALRGQAWLPPAP